jgi:sugar phosphate isomerase/epimerase
MYRNLNSQALGVSGRQSELIELALTYKFAGMNVEMKQIAAQAERHGLESACRLLQSAKLKVGCFDLPIRWLGEEGPFRADLARLKKTGETAQAIGATRCRLVVMPACNERPYHENFEFHRQRVSEIAEVLAPYGVSVGLDFLVSPQHRKDMQFQFVFSAEPLVLLAKTIGMPNVGVIVDAFDWHVGGGSAEDLKELTSQQIVDVRLASIATDANLEEVDEQQRLMPEAENPVPCVEIIKRLNEMAYQGPVSAVPSPSQLPKQPRDRTVKQAVDALEAIWMAAGLIASPKPVEEPVAEAEPVEAS